jgi:predicted RNA binding protein YcfA (HicA-like mRNA interferase family)
MMLPGDNVYMPMTQKEMIRLLKAHGWTKAIGGKGSHVKMSKPGNRPIIIPHGELNKFTELGIRKEAGLK